jgi:hypothetical protein
MSLYYKKFVLKSKFLIATYFKCITNTKKVTVEIADIYRAFILGYIPYTKHVTL